MTHQQRLQSRNVAAAPLRMCEPAESRPSPTPEPFLKSLPKGTIGHAHHGTKNTALPAPEAKLQPGQIHFSKLLPGLRSSGEGPEPHSISCSDTTQLAVSLSSPSSSLAHKAKRNLMGEKCKTSLELPGERVAQQMIWPL